MKKDIILLALSFPAFANAGEHGVIEFSPTDVKKDVADQVLDVIYGPDPFSRLPQNDVAVYLSDKVDPSIKEFIAAQLLSPNPKIDGVLDDKAEILHDLVRSNDESVYDYASRVNEIIAFDSETRLKESQLNSSK